MKEAVKTWIPVITLLAGVGGYWIYNQVAAHRELDERLISILTNQCKVSLESEGYTVEKKVEPSGDEKQ